jgi:hypothetical protein
MNSARGLLAFPFCACHADVGRHGGILKSLQIGEPITFTITLRGPLAVASRNARFAAPRPSACRWYCWAPRQIHCSMGSASCPCANEALIEGHNDRRSRTSGSATI